MVRLYLNERWAGIGVFVGGVHLKWGARHEHVAFGRVNRGYNLTGQDNLFALDVRVRRERSREERVGVQVDGVVEDALRVTHFLHDAEIHDCHAVAHVAHGSEVVRDHDVREAVLVLEVNEEVHYLSADGHVKRGHRLVESDDLWVQRKCARNTNPLALPAAELVREERRLIWR